MVFQNTQMIQNKGQQTVELKFTLKALIFQMELLYLSLEDKQQPQFSPEG
jgi:hypothetical protein